jgi:hypothetical protein
MPNAAGRRIATRVTIAIAAVAAAAPAAAAAAAAAAATEIEIVTAETETVEIVIATAMLRGGTDRGIRGATDARGASTAMILHRVDRKAPHHRIVDRARSERKRRVPMRERCGPVSRAPARHAPARHVPARHVPARHAPARRVPPRRVVAAGATAPAMTGLNGAIAADEAGAGVAEVGVRAEKTRMEATVTRTKIPIRVITRDREALPGPIAFQVAGTKAAKLLRLPLPRQLVNLRPRHASLRRHPANPHPRHALPWRRYPAAAATTSMWSGRPPRATFRARAPTTASFLG